MKSRGGPNVSVLHLRNTSEPWTLTDGEDVKVLLDNIKPNFIMDYENFLKNYEKQNKFPLDGCHTRSPMKSSYSPSRSVKRSETLCRADPHSTRKLINQRSAPVLDCGNGIKNGVCRSDSRSTIKSSKSFTHEYGKENEPKVERKYRQPCSSYPIISPPPGFEDDTLKHDNMCEYSASSLSSPRVAKYRLQSEIPKNIDLYYPKGMHGHRREELNGSAYKNAMETDHGPPLYRNNRKNQLINSYNALAAQRSYQPEEYLSNDAERQRKRMVKSSPDYYNYNEDVDRCKWRSPSFVPRRSFSTGNTSPHYYDDCNCYHMAPSCTAEEVVSMASKKGCNGIEYGNGRSYPEQRIRRSASFQTESTGNYLSSPPGVNGYGGSALQWRDYNRTRRQHYLGFNDEFDELHIGNASHLATDCCTFEDEDDEDEIFDDDMHECTCNRPADANGPMGKLRSLGTTAVVPQSYRGSRNRFNDECYPTSQTDICEVFNPPDIANVKSSSESHVDNYEYNIGDADFIRKQPDILQSAYYGNRTNRTSSVCSEQVAKNYIFSISSNSCMKQKGDIEAMRKKSCSLPKSFQRHEEVNRDLKLPTNPTLLLFYWRKYGLRGLFLNRKNSGPSTIMSETAPTTPVKEMPEKKRYGRLMRIGQYSSSPALDDDSVKHINFDCDTRYKKDKFKSNHPAALNNGDFRPASQENIVSGDGVFHKFCKSFSLRFLRKPTDHEVDGIQRQERSSPCSNDRIECESERTQSCRLGSQAWRSSSDRSRKIHIPSNKWKSREAHVSTDQRPGEKPTTSKADTQQRVVRRTLSDLNQYCTTIDDEKTNAIVPTRSKAPVPLIGRKYKSCSLRRSASQPLLNNKTSPSTEKKPPHCRTTCSEDERALFSEDDMMSDSGGSSLPSRKNSFEHGINEDLVIFAEAVWDHVAIESEELPFRAGDVIEVYNVLDREWWWGMCNGKSGWFPSDFVRLRVNQEESLQQRLSESPTKQNVSLTSLTNEQLRSKIICELLNTERDFVKILNDVREAFVESCQNAKELFTDEDIYKIFGNWNQISGFQAMFLENLERNFDEQHPHKTCVGQIFLEFREHFFIYSDYCNNHPLSIATLQQLYQKEEYKTFFENSRVKKNLIALPLDGFLLTPIQRICKYPLQLAELLKHTEVEHNDHSSVEDALNAMREVAILINERKRRMESLEKLILWQQRVEGWEGNNLIENSSQLIHQNDVTKVFAGVWTTNVTLFLFDHQLVFCKKDILRRDIYVYKGRISLDGCEVVDVPDGKDNLLGINIRNGLRIQNIEKNKWLLFCCRTQREKAEWLSVFHKEKELVLMDERNRLQITPMDRQLAYITATMCNSRHAFLKHKNKKLKRTINYSGQFRNPTSPHILGRRVGTWFMFGANRKNHRRFVSKNHSNAI